MARKRSRQMSAGVILITIGTLLLVTRFVSLQRAPLWLLGLGFGLALYGIFGRRYAAIVVGTVLLGIGAGMVLGDSGIAGLHKNAWLAFAVGAAFVAVYVLDLVLGLGKRWWPLLPGGAFLLLGLARTTDLLQLLPPGWEIVVRTWWPAAVVLTGIWLVFRR